MKRQCLFLLCCLLVHSSLSAPVTSPKEKVNVTKTYEDEVSELHTLIKPSVPVDTLFKAEKSKEPEGKKLMLQGIFKSMMQPTKETYEPVANLNHSQTEHSPALMVKRGLPKITREREGLYNDFQSEDGNDYDRINGDDWAFDSPEDTARDMAEYIFWTGDEVSVTQAVKDFLKQGLLSQSEAITFLESVRVHLKRMQIRYGIVDAAAPAEEAKDIVDFSEDDGLGATRQQDVNTDYVAERPFDAGNGLESGVGSPNMKEMLYEIGRIFFKQSMDKDGPRDTEEALHNLAIYLDAETDTGRITDATKTQILQNELFYKMSCSGNERLYGSQKRNIMTRVNLTNRVTGIRGYYAYHAPECEVLFASLVDAMSDNSETDHNKPKSTGRLE